MHNGNFVWKDRLTCFSVRRDPVLTCQTAHWKSYWLLWFVPSIKSDLSCKDADLWKIHPFKIPERKPEENDVKQHNPHWKHQSIRGPLKAARAWFSVYVGITNILANSFSVTHQADFISVHLEKKCLCPSAECDSAFGLHQILGEISGALVAARSARRCLMLDRQHLVWAVKTKTVSWSIEA